MSTVDHFLDLGLDLELLCSVDQCPSVSIRPDPRATLQDVVTLIYENFQDLRPPPKGHRWYFSRALRASSDGDISYDALTAPVSLGGLLDDTWEANLPSIDDLLERPLIPRICRPGE